MYYDELKTLMKVLKEKGFSIFEARDGNKKIFQYNGLIIKFNSYLHFIVEVSGNIDNNFLIYFNSKYKNKNSLEEFSFGSKTMTLNITDKFVYRFKEKEDLILFLIEYRKYLNESKILASDIISSTNENLLNKIYNMPYLTFLENFYPKIYNVVINKEKCLLRDLLNYFRICVNPYTEKLLDKKPILEFIDDIQINPIYTRGFKGQNPTQRLSLSSRNSNKCATFAYTPAEVSLAYTFYTDKYFIMHNTNLETGKEWLYYENDKINKQYKIDEGLLTINQKLVTDYEKPFIDEFNIAIDDLTNFTINNMTNYNEPIRSLKINNNK